MKTSIARIFFHKFSLLTNSKALCLSHSQNLRQSLFSLYFLQSTEFARVLFWFEVSATAPVFHQGKLIAKTYPPAKTYLKSTPELICRKFKPKSCPPQIHRFKKPYL
ncbi:hypothetical protein [Roseburia faecis]|uniref:hypothetical protein n=1 Tax=Roseburia faecis TaxID=301302 RepID=UPI0019D39882|nr:hypothetical protein [Roseburia faecis]